MIDQTTDKQDGDRVVLRINTMTMGKIGRTGTVRMAHGGVLGVHWDDDPNPSSIHIELNGEPTINLCDRTDDQTSPGYNLYSNAQGETEG